MRVVARFAPPVGDEACSRISFAISVGIYGPKSAHVDQRTSKVPLSTPDRRVRNQILDPIVFCPPVSAIYLPDFMSFLGNFVRRMICKINCWNVGVEKLHSKKKSKTWISSVFLLIQYFGFIKEIDSLFDKWTQCWQKLTIHSGRFVPGFELETRVFAVT